jgi:hypothetical protein
MKPLHFFVCLIFTANALLSQTYPVAQTNTATVITGSKKGEKIPASILNTFKTEYPNELPSWYMDKKNYRASFIDSKMGNGHAVAYDKKGAVVYREEQLAKGNYPASIDTYFATKSPQDKYGVWSSMDRSGKQRYFADRNKETLWFDEAGNYVKTVQQK